MPEDLDLNDDTPEDSPVIRDLRKQAETAKTEKERADNAERELTLHKAGLGGLSEKQMKALTAAHDGDWEPESIKATATELGFMQTGTDIQQSPEPKVPQGELDAMGRVAQASGGTPPPPPDLDAAIAEANTPEELKAVLRNAGRLIEGD